MTEQKMTLEILAKMMQNQFLDLKKDINGINGKLDGMGRRMDNFAIDMRIVKNKLEIDTVTLDK